MILTEDVRKYVFAPEKLSILSSFDSNQLDGLGLPSFKLLSILSSFDSNYASDYQKYDTYHLSILSSFDSNSFITTLAVNPIVAFNPIKF